MKRTNLKYWLTSALVLACGCSSVPQKPDGAWTEKQTVYFDQMNVARAWTISKGAGIKIGIVDGGFDYEHPGLKGRIQKIYSYPGALHPTDMRTLAHGTFAASIIGAVPADGGMTGVCPGCEMLGAEMGIIEHWAIKNRLAFFKANPNATAQDYENSLEARKTESAEFDNRWLAYVSSSVAGSVYALTDGGAKVIAMSLMLAGLEGDNLKQVEDAIAYAAAHDVVIVMGAGNNAQYIAAYPGPDAVTLIAGCSDGAAVWRQTMNYKGKEITQGTNYGPALDVLAPCGKVVVANPHKPQWYKVSDGPRGPYDVAFTGPYEVYEQGGTSIAVPFAAGAAALVRAANPALTAAQTANIMRAAAEDMGPKGRDDESGWGRLNFYNAVLKATQRDK